TYSDGGGIVDFILTDDNTVLYLANEGIYMVDLTNPGSAISVYTFDQPRSPLKMTYDIKNNYIYFLETDLYKYANGIVEKMASPKSGSNFYGLAVKPSSGEVYVTDTKDYVQPGDLIRYDQSFSDTTIYAMGINPQFILFQ
ncbi:MAG: DNA-binding beta-propeller fold protein YncE, partial [Dokdonia sp.]